MGVTVLCGLLIRGFTVLLLGVVCGLCYLCGSGNWLVRDSETHHLLQWLCHKIGIIYIYICGFLCMRQ